MTDEVSREILARIEALSQHLAEHKVASARRGDEMLEHIGAIGHAQRSNSAGLHELREEVQQVRHRLERAEGVAKRADSMAAEAKRVAADLVQEAETVFEAIKMHNDGIGSRLSRQDAELGAIRKETTAQTATLESIKASTTTQISALGAGLEKLMKAEDDRRVREDAIEQLRKKDADRLDRRLKNGAIYLTFATALITALLWLLRVTIKH